jgi:hypothetical protein
MTEETLIAGASMTDRTLDELATAAGRKPTDIRPAGESDDIDILRAHCTAFMVSQGKSEALSMAKSKLEEMIFWLRRHRERQQQATTA